MGTGDHDDATRGPEYRPAFQTWRLVHGPPRAAVSHGPATEKHAGEQVAEEKTRHRLQRLRIDRRMTVAQLADAVKCDVAVVAAYERGDAVLDADVVRRMERVLGRAPP